MDPASFWFVVGWTALHLSAVAIAIVTRIAAGSAFEIFAQLCFFAAMTAIGIATWICQQVDFGWSWSALTLVAMVLVAVCDFRRMSEPVRVS